MRLHLHFIFLFLVISNVCNAETQEEDSPKFKRTRHDKFVVVTPEKTGTHLLMKITSQLINKKWRMFWDRNIPTEHLQNLLTSSEKNHIIQHFHVYPTVPIIRKLQELQYKVIYLIRDPRDQLISLLFYIRDKDWGYGPLRMNAEFGALSFDEQLLEAITGKRYGISIPKEIYSRRRGWLQQNQAFVLTTRFEDLVGQEGGGTRERQLNEIRAIVDFLNIKITEQQIIARSQGLFGKPGEGTFRSGKIGDWRRYFNEQHIEAFKKTFGYELIELGYEQNLNW